MADVVTVVLTRDQAMVLFDWLARTGSSGRPAVFEDQAEQRALWLLETSLESSLSEPLASDYRDRVEAARRRLRDEA